MAAAPEKVAAAIARKNGWTVEASGATAANQLGLSTQVPARIVLRTDGPSRTIDVGGWKIELRHTVPRFLGRGRHSPRLLQGLRWMGPSLKNVYIWLQATQKELRQVVFSYKIGGEA